MRAGHRLLIGGLLAMGVVVWLATGGSTAPAGPSQSATVASATSPSSATQSTSAATTVPKETLVATMPTSGAPAAHKPGGPIKLHIPGFWQHGRSILPVIGQQGDWYHVRLAQRPNGSTAWVRSRYVVRLNTDPYHVVIDLSAMHMHLYKDGKQIGYFPLGIGVPADPTPRGHFFVAVFTAAPSPAWGAFVILTSAHSSVFTNWESTGDGITGIHGPLGADAQIGTTGARVSHGCVRMHKAQLLHLRPLPIGTPIDIHL